MEGGFAFLVILGVVLVGIFAYLLFMVFLPEWVGITGKTAIENERSHRGGEGEEGEVKGGGSADLDKKV